jgi:hypothetical protein
VQVSPSLTICCALESRSGQVAHHPEARPPSHLRWRAREDDVELHVASLEAELVPALQHAGSEVEIVHRFVVHCDLQIAVGSVDLLRSVPCTGQKREEADGSVYRTRGVSLLMASG